MTDTKETKIVGGDGLVDGKTTHGEDIKGNSTFNKPLKRKDDTTGETKGAALQADQQEVEAEANTPDSLLPADGEQGEGESKPDEESHEAEG